MDIGIRAMFGPSVERHLNINGVHVSPQGPTMTNFSPAVEGTEETLGDTVITLRPGTQTIIVESIQGRQLILLTPAEDEEEVREQMRTAEELYALITGAGEVEAEAESFGHEDGLLASRRARQG